MQTLKNKTTTFQFAKAAHLTNVCYDICQNAPAGDTNKDSSDEEVCFIDQVPTMPIVAIIAVLCGT